MGADGLAGGLGDDSLYSNQFAGVPVEDGAIDTLDGSTAEVDFCRIPFAAVEADVTISCESIDQD